MCIRDSIRRVKSAAKTDLEHDKIAVSLREPIERERGDEPVSYTHLDVYKRQTIHYRSLGSI